MNDELKAFSDLQHISPSKFSQSVKDLVKKTGSSYIEAVSTCCTKFDIEVDSVKSLITHDLLDYLIQEGEELHIIKKSGRLKI